MKILAPLFVVAILLGLVTAAPVSLPLKDGSVIKGEITSASATEVVVATEYGVIRVPAVKLSDEAKKAAGLDKPASSQQYEARIAALETRIRTLEAENAALRRAATSTSSNPAPSVAPVRPASLVPESTTPPAAAGGNHSISSTGKRHNTGCRYFGSGSPCGPTDGVACKICKG